MDWYTGGGDGDWEGDYSVEEIRVIMDNFIGK